jgi:hypothetical protein
MFRLYNLYWAMVVSASSDSSYLKVYKKLNCVDSGHSFENSVRLEKVVLQCHPSNKEDWVFTVNLRKCLLCGGTFFDNGMEERKIE